MATRSYSLNIYTYSMHSSKSSRKDIGNLWEDIAVKFLEKKWYHIVMRNFQVKWWEIDIVATSDKLTVFVEVRYRINDTHGHPLDTFSSSKRRAMKRAVMLYAQRYKIDLDAIRIDFIGIMPIDWKHRVWHIKGVDI